MSKRVFDLFFAVAGVIVLSPVFLVLSLITKLYDGGTVFFQQTRVGFKGKPFKMLKFRSMVQDAPKLGAALTVGADSRITPLGKILRKFKLDELPQLINVVMGDMSLVGPRPEVPGYVAVYNGDQRRVLNVRPGITDPASFAFFDESELLAKAADPERFYIDHLMPEKIRINLEYAAKANLGTDFVLILATLGKAVGFHFDIFKRFHIRPPEVTL